MGEDGYWWCPNCELECSEDRITPEGRHDSDGCTAHVEWRYEEAQP